MGEGQCRSTGRRVQEDSSWLERPQKAARAWIRATHPATWLLAVMALLVPSPSALPRACAQDEPPKVEAPKPAPPAAPDQAKDATPPPADVQKKGSAPTEKQPPPPAVDDLQKAPGSAPDTAELDKALDAAEALSSRFRFIERYGVTADPTHPELLTEYRVGVQETRKIVSDRPQAAPETVKRTRRSIYTERVAQANRQGDPTDLVRRYDIFQFKDAVTKPPLVEGLLVWYHRRPPLRPQVMSLTTRPIREYEYRFIAEEVSIPQLLAFFPLAPVRVSETWEILPNAVFKILGEEPDPNDFNMTGTLQKVTKAPDGKGLVAEIEITGQFNAPFAGLSAFHATIDFQFAPPGLALPAAGSEAIPKVDGREPGSRGRAQAGVVLATGGITKARLSHAAARPIPGGDDRLKMTVTSELVLERRSGERAGQYAPLSVPDPPPTANEENSWLIYDDPAGRFQLRHPQELRPQGEYTTPGALIELVHEQPGTAMFAVLQLPLEREHYYQDPTGFDKWVEADFRKERKITRGPSGYLDAKDWKDRRVYRHEAAISPADAAEQQVDRVYVDSYLVSLEGKYHYMFQAWAKATEHVAFRRQAEEIIKSFQVGPADRAGRVRSPAPSTTNPVRPSPGSPPSATDRPKTQTPGANPETRGAAPGSIPAPNSPPR